MSNIFKRINDVLSANLNDLIDRVEDPDRMIKQIIREMEENILRARESVVEAIASEKKLQKELEANRQQAADWLGKAEAALRAGHEDLARSALARKKEHDDIVRALEPAWGSANATSDRLKNQLRALEAKLEEARRKRGMLVARQRAAEAREQLGRTQTRFDDGYAAGVQFDRMADRVADMEARSAALDELERESSPLEKEFLDLEVQQEVDFELAKLKIKLRQE
ncbi:MAG: PspA/IM30 family protein [Candidatus Methylumidiphilus sp.]